jgi:hypothetical protein
MPLVLLVCVPLVIAFQAALATSFDEEKVHLRTVPAESTARSCVESCLRVLGNFAKQKGALNEHELAVSWKTSEYLWAPEVAVD